MLTNFWRQLKKPIIGLAPMDGVTDEPMRQIQVQIAKPAVMFTEFVSVEGFVKDPKRFQKKLFFLENERPIIVQVFGYTPSCFFKAVEQLSKMGFDGIDINMGCPAKSVVLRGGGAALIGDYDLAEKIIIQCQKAITASRKKLPLSIKTRIGCRGVTTKEWFSFLSKFALAEVTIHGRPIKQGNSGPVNWEEIKIAKEILKAKGITCLGNGGVKSLKEAAQKSQDYDLDGVLIGQAALGNPWFFKENYQPTKQEIFAIILEHGQLAQDFFGEKGFVSVLKHFSWYPRGFKESKKLKTEILKTKNIDQAREVLKRFGN